ncbi:DNA-binding beta-propeller fold protein YncE [Paenibacillus castaneae]|uniref:NHL repeat-containing protein n=1 Tax=Paenibacillus castaneae TaxID=474957 RepID=UPI000C9A5FD9|nr:NHL repeat-containing protein [Paenibacillus castaneae]NIK79596.1 DNA-binding beta-propeller fold protein YncE [Paenibacillus castaneae]
MKQVSKFRFVVSTAIALLMLVTALPVQTYAASPYEGYTRNKLGDDVHSINGYIYESSIDGYDLSSGPFSAPEDVFLADDGTIYIVDTGNSRIVHLNKKHELLGIIGDEEGDGKLYEPKGVFVKQDGTIYVADTKNQRIAIFDQKGKFQNQFGKPENPLLGATFSYSPSKLLVDKRNYMFVVSDGNTQGLIQIDPNGQFKGFYGANHVGFSWSRLINKLVATDEQKAKLSVVKPLEFSNAVQDEEGFIYTSTLGTEMNQLKRLSPVGVDTLNIVPRRYGGRFDNGPFSVPSFLDLAVDKDGVITALDLQSSKVYQYDKLGNFLFVFGGLGDQNGLFITPSSLAQSPDGTVFVVDKGRNRVDLFRTTPFAELVHDASRLFVDGRYKEAEGLWNEVLHLNGNFDLAYLAIGKSLFKAENYKDAMTYFELARSRYDYSIAFKEYRKEYIRENFAWICLIIVVIIIALRYILPFLWRRVRIMLSARRLAGAAHIKGGVPHDRNL